MAAGKTDHPLERLVFFSDAVFAIAITLLVIEIHPPHLPRHASDMAHWAALAELIPNFLGYFISFAVIGAFWMGHHRIFALSTHYSPRILGWNMGLLGVIAFMPFVTAYLASNMNARVPAVIYCVAMLVAGLFSMKVNWIATSPPMVDEAATAEDIAFVRRRSLSVALGAATAVGFSFVIPEIAQAGLISIPIWRRILARVSRTRPAAA